jgi:hypothetical protein
MLYCPKPPLLDCTSLFYTIYQVLPSKAYYNFMNRGYFSQLDDGRLEHLMEFYSRCIQFSEDTTRLEISINNLERNDENFEIEIGTLVQQIRISHLSAMHGFDYHYEGDHGFNPNNRVLYR